MAVGSRTLLLGVVGRSTESVHRGPLPSAGASRRRWSGMRRDGDDHCRGMSECDGRCWIQTPGQPPRKPAAGDSAPAPATRDAPRRPRVGSQTPTRLKFSSVTRERPGACGRSAAGSASPCQGEGRGFESRRPLGAAATYDGGNLGGVAERRGNGLQSRVRGFKSRPHLGNKHGRLAQWERASLTRKRSLVQTQYRPPEEKGSSPEDPVTSLFACGAPDVGVTRSPGPSKSRCGHRWGHVVVRPSFAVGSAPAYWVCGRQFANALKSSHIRRLGPCLSRRLRWDPVPNGRGQH